jgi:hypothetical protein
MPDVGHGFPAAASPALPVRGTNSSIPHYISRNRHEGSRLARSMSGCCGGTPMPKGGDALVSVDACGISATDLTIFSGKHRDRKHLLSLVMNL